MNSWQNRTVEKKIYAKFHSFTMGKSESAQFYATSIYSNIMRVLNFHLNIEYFSMFSIVWRQSRDRKLSKADVVFCHKNQQAANSNVSTYGNIIFLLTRKIITESPNLALSTIFLNMICLQAGTSSMWYSLTLSHVRWKTEWKKITKNFLYLHLIYLITVPMGS